MKPFFTESDCDEIRCTYHKNCISLGRANELLQKRGEVVRGACGDGQPITFYRAHPDGGAEYTHKALLVCVEEIEADSAEKVLADLLKADEFCATHGMIVDPHAFIERARKLQGAK